MFWDERDGLVVHRFESVPEDRLDVFVSTRTGGVSAPPYDSLNLGLRVGDRDDDVVANRRRLFDAFDLPLERSVWCRQVHRDTVTVVTADELRPREDGGVDRGAFTEETIVGATDALVTDLVGVPMCVTLADCVPVVLYDPARHVVGLAHAGWGGTVARIASRTVATMQERYGSEPGQLIAAIGPSISPDRYEVGGDVIERARVAYGAAPVLRETGGGRALLDLWEANAVDLEQAGVARERIEVAGISTIDDLAQFYSHRAEQVTGRFIAAVTLRPR